MGRCSYVWVGWDKVKRKRVRNCRKVTWKGSDEFCFLGDSSPDTDVDLFQRIIEEKVNESFKVIA
jgi:hypothetical protein